MISAPDTTPVNTFPNKVFIRFENARWSVPASPYQPNVRAFGIRQGLGTDYDGEICFPAQLQSGGLIRQRVAQGDEVELTSFGNSYEATTDAGTMVYDFRPSNGFSAFRFVPQVGNSAGQFTLPAVMDPATLLPVSAGSARHWGPFGEDPDNIGRVSGQGICFDVFYRFA